MELQCRESGGAWDREGSGWIGYVLELDGQVFFITKGWGPESR